MGLRQSCCSERRYCFDHRSFQVLARFLPRHLILSGWLSASKTPRLGRFVLVSEGSSVAIIVALLFLLFSWVQPLHFLPWVSWHSEVLAFLAVMLLAWYGVFGAAKKNLSAAISFPVTAIPLLALVLLIWLQSARGLIAFQGDTFVLTI